MTQPLRWRTRLERRARQHWRPGLAGPVAALVIALLAACGGAPLPTGDAEWIWADLPPDRVGPVAFWAVRDFDLEAAPAEAELLALADEEYVLWLNGHRVGSNRYRAGAPLDVYPVAPLLVTGANRLAVEVRSSRGAGGLLAALVLPGGDAAVVTDRSWHLLPRHHPGIVPAWQPVGAGEGLVSWGRPPVGRWGRPERGPGEGRPRPLAAAAGLPCDPLPAVARRGEAPGRVVFDFGREVTGYLALIREPAAAAGPSDAALLLTGAEPLAPLEHPRQAVPVVTLPGLPVWTDVVPRRFRYAVVSGLPGLAAAQVLPVFPEALGRLPEPRAEGLAAGERSEADGIVGLRPPVRTSPTEEAVRRRVLGTDASE
ncbi:MAG TPA: hypothetical protein VHQ65_09620 [Thermoanaerobaculia bacterium]|nr:hypothetical protein [Thermoanaerobaculia bacterium]